MDEKRIWGLVASGAWASVIKGVYDHAQRVVVSFDCTECNNEISLNVDGEKWNTTTPVGSQSFELHCDPLRNSERKFIKLLELYLTDCVDRGEVDGLIVVASPRTLGDLRRVYSPQVSLRIIKQISPVSNLKRESDVLDYFDSCKRNPQICC